MLVGAAIYAEVYPALKTNLLTWGNLGKITLPQILGVSHWVIVPVFIVGALALFWLFEKMGL
jgi:hypothetical protein